MTEKLYTVDNLAEIFSYNPQTIRNLIRKGRIKAFKLGNGKKAPWRILQVEVERLQMIGFEEQMKELKQQLKDEYE